MRLKKRPAPPTPTPLQADLDAIASRLAPAMREGAGPALERVRRALDGTADVAIGAAQLEAQTATTAAGESARELDNLRRSSTANADLLSSVIGVLKDLPAKPKAAELKEALYAIANIVDVTIGEHAADE